ncbi:MAG: cytochrome P450 [Acidimicrobiales bacterium]
MADRPIVDFDHHSNEFHQNRHAEWAELRTCPVAFNPRFGGFWVVSSYDEVATVSRDGETFSSKYVAHSDDGIDYLGITGVPRAKTMPTAGIAEVEGPIHQALRRVINPFLVPHAVDRLQPLMERIATWFLDQRIESGEMDLVLDLTNPVPAILTMELVGLPLDSWQHYAELFHGTVAHGPGNPEFDQALANLPAMLAELGEEAAARRSSPRDDLLTALVDLRLDDGRQLTDDEVRSVLWNLVGGGLDTTTSLTSLALHHLNEHPELRAELIERPELIGTATEEFLRYLSVNESLTRTVTRDVELGGQQLRRGDHLMLSWLSANRDGSTFERADEVVLDRAPNPHLALGVGPHRCIGMHMARTMFQVLMREVLMRIPDYRVDREATRFYAGNPELNGVVRMPATFTPGPVVGPPERPF